MNSKCVKNLKSVRSAEEKLVWNMIHTGHYINTDIMSSALVYHVVLNLQLGFTQRKKKQSNLGTGGRRMTIKFKFTATIEVPDADKFPPKERAEKDLMELFISEGMIPHELKLIDYYVEQEG